MRNQRRQNLNTHLNAQSAAVQLQSTQMQQMQQTQQNQMLNMEDIEEPDFDPEDYQDDWGFIRFRKK